MDKYYFIGKKWKKTVSYTIWMFEYYVRRTRNELDLDEVDALLVMGLKNSIITQPNKLKLNSDQMKFLLVMVDYVNRKLLTELEPPFTTNEMSYFSTSQSFMRRFNRFDNIYKEWAESRLKVLDIIKV